jgi:hypothetical protein
LKAASWMALAQAHRLVANQQWALGAYSNALQNITAAVVASEELNQTHPKNLEILKELAFDYEVRGQVQTKSGSRES